MSDDNAFRELLDNAARRGIAYRETVGDRSVAQTRDAVAAVERFVEPLPENGTDDADTLALLDDVGSPASNRRKQLVVGRVGLKRLHARSNTGNRKTRAGSVGLDD